MYFNFDVPKGNRFLISDETGLPILSFPDNITDGKGLFDGIISDSDVALISEAIRSFRYDAKIVARDMRTGRAVIISLSLYSSLRLLAAVFTDIDHKAACAVARESFSSLICSWEGKVRLSERHEQVYLSLAQTLSVLDTATSDFRGRESFMSYLQNKAEIASLLTGCEISVDIPMIKATDAEDFSGSLFSLFLITSLSYAFRYSDMRRADVVICRENGRIAARVEIPLGNERKMTDREAKKLRDDFYSMFFHIYSACDRLGAPFSVMRGDSIVIEIMPLKIDPSKLGLKVGFRIEKAEETLDLLFM